MTDEKQKDAPADFGMKVEPGMKKEPIRPDERSERPLLGKIKTDEEARLAAEIEKLRG